MIAGSELVAPGNYPSLSIRRIQEPNRGWAFPILGIVAKGIILIPMFVWLYILGLAAFVVVVLINPLVVLFTGRYWDPAYDVAAGLLRVQTKAELYLFGLTDRYPGFSLSIPTDEFFSLDIPRPEGPSHMLAIPVVGGLIRLVLLIPFFIWTQIVGSAAGLAVMVASFPVLFTGRYPESLFELARDATRVSLASACYLFGLSDTYPSFTISMNNPGVKWLFIALGVLMTIGQLINNLSHSAPRGR